MTDQQLRIKALEMTQNPNLTTDVWLANAERVYDFINGASKQHLEGQQSKIVVSLPKARARNKRK